MRVVFVHGAFVRDGAWWWEPTAELLRQHNITSMAVALPSCGETGTAPTGAGPGLFDDAAAVRDALSTGEPSIVIAHSYGGMVVSQAATADTAAKHLFYISSFLPHIGQSLADISTAENPVPVQPHADGSISVTGDDLDARVLHDVGDPELIRGAHARLTPQSSSVFGTPVTEAAWKQLPSTYLVCTDDRNTAPSLQREHAARATHTRELPTGHHPFLSHPKLVAAAIIGCSALRCPEARLRE